MNDPDVRVVIRGFTQAQRQLIILLRERRRLEHMAAELRRRLAKVDLNLSQVQRQLRRP